MKSMAWLTTISHTALAASAMALSATVTAQAGDDNLAFLPRAIVSSTSPANGDLNPYGIAFVPPEFPAGGSISAGDVLVSNFNNSGNTQGTGTTIISLKLNGAVAPAVTPPGSSGNAVTFFQSSPQQVGLSTALGVLKAGFVLVGNVPTSSGAEPLGQGSLQIIDRNGNLLTTLVDGNFLNDPWDLTINDQGSEAQVFVSNVANGTSTNGTVTRLDLAITPTNVTVSRRTIVATGYAVTPNAAAVVLGPTGLAYDPFTDVLFVASTGDNAIFAVPGAGKAAFPTVQGTLVFSDPHLRGPLGLAFAPNGHLLTANGDAVNADPTHPSEIVEFTVSGKFVRESNFDAFQGAAFGIATKLLPHTRFNFAAVNDDTNMVEVFGVRPPDDELALGQ